MRGADAVSVGWVVCVSGFYTVRLVDCESWWLVRKRGGADRKGGKGVRRVGPGEDVRIAPGADSSFGGGHGG